MIFRSRRKRDATALAEPARDPAADLSTEELLAETERLTRANREHRDPATEQRLVELRHLVGLRLMDSPAGTPSYPEPAFDRLPAGNGELPGVRPDELTPELVRAGILRDGCLLVRGLIDNAEAENLVDEIDRAFQARDAIGAGSPADEGYYHEFEPDPRFMGFLARDWVAGGGGLWAADSPHLLFGMLDAFERSGLSKVVREYLGEQPTISVQKCTLRRADPDAGHGWHQDGAFMGDVRALNVWVSLSRCGDESPGLDIVPRRLDHIVPTGTEGALFDWSVSEQMAQEAAADAGVLRPIFEAGDVLLFDELFLHATAAEPSMKKSRWAIESWFFGSSASPEDYAPLAA
jgi:Phytanoyl-CoA dioxygenase (PhyH)